MKSANEIENRNLFGISKQERREIEVEESLEHLSYYLDDWIRIPGIGWRFGLDAIIGLVPGVGDTVTSLASFYILVAAVRYGVPKITILRMALNIALDYLIGAIPVIGDTFDFFWKSNKMNMKLIRERGTGKNKSTTGDYIFVFGLIIVLIAVLIVSILLGLFVLGTIFKGIWDLF